MPFYAAPDLPRLMGTVGGGLSRCLIRGASECGVGGGTGITTAAATVVLMVMNKVLYKLMLVPMRNYSFFLAQFTTSG
jgi:hypothetical protein